jgi:hypothetical protein
MFDQLEGEREKAKTHRQAVAEGTSSPQGSSSNLSDQLAKVTLMGLKFCRIVALYGQIFRVLSPTVKLLLLKL